MSIDPEWLLRRYVDDQATVETIAAEAGGVALSTVHRALRAAGIPPRGKPGARMVRTLDRDWLVARRSEGMAWDAIAKDVGIDRSSVLWQAAGFGLYDLPDHDKEIHRRATRAAAKYRRGQSLATVAAAMGVDRRTVTRWLRALGVEIRPPGHPEQS